MENETKLIQQKYQRAGYPSKFINSTIKQFQEKETKKSEDLELMLPVHWFEEKKELLLIELPFCFKNEKLSKRFISTLNNYTVSFERPKPTPLLRHL